MSADAFATGQHVAFAGKPDLHTAAHEAAHVVQQRAGVHLRGGLGEAEDSNEQHADAVADAVVRGEPAQELLDTVAATGTLAGTGGSAPIQLKGWVGESMERAKQQLSEAEGVPERSHVTDGGVETIAPGRYRIWGFPVDSAEPPARVSGVLDEVVRLYAADPKSRLTIEGHTSSSGSERHNAGLSTLRANRVLALLIFRGLSPTRVNIVSAGESTPLNAENANALLMARNRRVELQYEGEFPSRTANVVSASQDESSVKPPDDGPGLGCADLRSQARMLRVQLEAWVMFSGSRGGSALRGHRDPGLDADRIAPDRQQIRNAASLNGYYQISDYEYSKR